MSSVEFKNTELPDIIELRKIRQTYDKGKTVVFDNLNLLIERRPYAGQFVSLLGASGCGKSTVLRYIAGLQTPTEGEVFVNGKPRADSDHINMIFQKYSSFPWMSVLDNVALGLKFQGVKKPERHEKAMEMIKVVGLEDHINKYAQSPTLSGGQLQRVAIARSLLVNKDILLMDEPFGALDVRTRLKMQDRMIEIWEKLHPTIILVTHDISEAVYLSNDIYIMSPKGEGIVDYIRVPIPPGRTRETKRDPKFIELTQLIEDKMMQYQ